MEDIAQRDRRLRNGSPIEIIETLLNSIDNFFLKIDIATAVSAESWMLVVLGLHAIALTISYGLFNLNGSEAYKRFLEEYVDGEEVGMNFSEIHFKLHTFRNVIAHRWLSQSNYDLFIDNTIESGWKELDGVIHFNVKKYFEAFQGVFGSSSKLWRYDEGLSAEELEAIKDRFLSVYDK